MTNPFQRPPKVDPLAHLITGIAMVDPRPSNPWVVLERIEPGVTPDYCTHGRVTCLFCDEWCWLGDKTHELVRAGEANPICIQCATERFPKGARASRKIQDHRRSDGPHD